MSSKIKINHDGIVSVDDKGLLKTHGNDQKT